MSSGRCRRLLGWYRKAARDLPWRRTREPYRVWVSEIMLQQTQVATVLPRYEAWFARFPDIPALARAETDAVLKAWEGLGYYRRARLLHAAARQIMDRHGGRFPQAFDDIVALPGIGRSTAGAIASICFGARAPVLDGNVKRVLERWHGEPKARERRLWELAGKAIADAPEPGDWNQAMMELGATVCTPRSPACEACPVKGDCASAFAPVEAGATNPAPVKDVFWRVSLHASSRGIWLVRRPATGIWAGLWTPPITELDARPGREPDHVHLLTHRRLHLYLKRAATPPQGAGRWARAPELPAMPTGIRRLLEKGGVI